MTTTRVSPPKIARRRDLFRVRLFEEAVRAGESFSLNPYGLQGRTGLAY